eukprot:3014178-Prymnesium_polylepis.1
MQRDGSVATTARAGLLALVVVPHYTSPSPPGLVQAWVGQNVTSIRTFGTAHKLQRDREAPPSNPGSVRD